MGKTGQHHANFTDKTTKWQLALLASSFMIMTGPAQAALVNVGGNIYCDTVTGRGYIRAGGGDTYEPSVDCSSVMSSSSSSTSTIGQNLRNDDFRNWFNGNQFFYLKPGQDLIIQPNGAGGNRLRIINNGDVDEIGDEDSNQKHLQQLLAEQAGLQAELNSQKGQFNQHMIDMERHHQLRREAQKRLLKQMQEVNRLTTEEAARRYKLGVAQAKIQDAKNALDSKATELRELLTPSTSQEAVDAIVSDMEKIESLRQSETFSRDTYEVALEVKRDERIAAEAKASKIQAEMNQHYENAENSRKQAAAVEAKIGKTQSELARVNTLISVTRAAIARGNEFSTNQSAEGLPPDADFLDRLKRATWWSQVNVGRSEDTSGTTNVTNNNASLTIGANLRINERVGMGFAVGFAHSETDEGATSDTSTNGLNLKLYGGYQLRPNIALDGSLGYGIGLNDNTNAGVTDDYTTQNLGLSTGISATNVINERWRAIGRLGYQTSWTRRASSVDSAGIAQAATNSDYGALSLTGTLQHRFENGTAFASSTLNAVTHGRDADRVDAQLAAGVRFDISDSASLTTKAYYNDIFRDDVQGYGGSLRLEVQF